ncbi:hypothetical protein GCM10023329_10930 [Streptomyces sanyensis]|uniref:Uncharacterized protein n=1 Tax=Streptomyces sanyensis TaxID=568869 RepID=A0ABP8ZUG5_9ACTN
MPPDAPGTVHAKRRFNGATLRVRTAGHDGVPPVVQGLVREIVRVGQAGDRLPDPPRAHRAVARPGAERRLHLPVLDLRHPYVVLHPVPGLTDVGHPRPARGRETLPARSEAVIHLAMTDLMARRLTGEAAITRRAATSQKQTRIPA